MQFEQADDLVQLLYFLALAGVDGVAGNLVCLIEATRVRCLSLCGLLYRVLLRDLLCYLLLRRAENIVDDLVDVLLDFLLCCCPGIVGLRLNK